MQQCLPVLRSTELLFILLCLNRFELGAHIIVIHLEFKHFLITDRIGDHIGMQLPPEDAPCRFCSRSIFREDGRAGEAKLVIPLKLLLQVALCLAELAAVALVEDEDHLLHVEGKIALSPHQMV